MKGLVIFLAVVATLILGVGLGGFIAQKHNSYEEVKEEANLQSNEAKSQSNIQSEEKPKEEVVNSKPKEEAVNKADKKERTYPKDKKEPLEKEYDIYYYLDTDIEKNGENYLVLDMIYMYYDTRYTNDYYIVNDNPKLRTYKVSKNAKFNIYNSDYSELVSLDYKSFIKFLPTESILDIKFSGNEIVSVKQIYVP